MRAWALIVLFAACGTERQDPVPAVEAVHDRGTQFVAVSDDAVFTSEPGGGPVTRRALDGSERVVSDLRARWLTVEDGSLYFVTDDAVVRVPEAGGDAESRGSEATDGRDAETVASDLRLPQDLVVRHARACFTAGESAEDVHDRAIFCASSTGVVRIGDASDGAGGLAFDGDDLVSLEDGALRVHTPDGATRVVGEGIVAKLIGARAGIAYVVSDERTLIAYRLDTGAPRELAHENASIRCTFVGERELFFATAVSVERFSRAPSRGELYRVPLARPAPTSIARGFSTCLGMAQGQDAIWIGTYAGLFRTPAG